MFIPHFLSETAYIEGASFWEVFNKINLPW